MLEKLKPIQEAFDNHSHQSSINYNPEDSNPHIKLGDTAYNQTLVEFRQNIARAVSEAISEAAAAFATEC